MKKFKIVNGDSLDVLKKLPDNSISAIVTDPPYGLSNTDPKHVITAMEKWASGERDYVPARKGFMGKDWDAFVPPPALWDECFRVLKPGGHLLAFAGSRTYDLMGLSVRFAGFEIRDGIAWLYGSGFPKSLDVSKAIDKAAGAERGAGVEKVYAGGHIQRSNGTDLGIVNDDGWVPTEGRTVTAPATPDAERWQGWGTALKPAMEPIVMARKPLAEKTVVKNVLAHGTGALNIDASRIAGVVPQVTQGLSSDPSSWEPRSERRLSNPHTSGRWPANVILSHTEDCELVGVKKIKAITGTNSGRGAGSKAEDSEVYGKYAGRTDMERGAAVGKGDADGKETVEDWHCVEGCPVAELDAQSGERKAGGKVKGHEPSRTGQNRVENAPYNDIGGASRFFYVAKAPKKERPVSEAEDGARTVHPTVKPLTLMRYLVRMVTPPGGIVLDPFAGSGTTIEAAALEGFSALGIEAEAEYIELIKVRMDKHKPEGEQ